MGVQWISTDKHVYGAIYREHHGSFRVVGSESAPRGNKYHEFPYMMTQWGLRQADEPLIKLVATKQSMDQKEYDYAYFIAVVIHEEDA